MKVSGGVRYYQEESCPHRCGMNVDLCGTDVRDASSGALTALVSTRPEWRAAVVQGLVTYVLTLPDTRHLLIIPILSKASVVSSIHLRRL